MLFVSLNITQRFNFIIILNQCNITYYKLKQYVNQITVDKAEDFQKLDLCFSLSRLLRWDRARQSEKSQFTKSRRPICPLTSSVTGSQSHVSQ